MNSACNDPSVDDRYWDSIEAQAANEGRHKSGGKRGRPSRYLLEDFDTLEPGMLTWRVKYLWPAVGVCFVVAPSTAGKSFWVLDAMARICRGEPVLGRKSKPCGVVYIAAEGAHGVRNRIVGLRERIGPLGGRLRFVGQQPNLKDPEDVDALRTFLAETKDELEVAGHGLGVVVVDTMAASTPGADENTSTDMGAVLQALQNMAVDFRCLVLVVAHTGKDETRGIRGWSGQTGNADGIIAMTLPDGDLRLGTVTKVKDGPSGDKFAFKLEVVNIGIDDDGDPITTCVIVEEQAPDHGSAARPGPKPTKATENGKLLLRVFNCVGPEQFVSRSAPGLSLNSQALDVDVLRREAFARGFGPTEPIRQEYESEADFGADRRRWRDNRNKAFDRARGRLIDDKLLRQEGNLLWRLDAEAAPKSSTN